jgi:hypothetical protein
MYDEDRLVLLLDHYADRVITAAELVELEEMLRRSPVARDRFWSELSWNATLRIWGEAAVATGPGHGQAGLAAAGGSPGRITVPAPTWRAARGARRSGQAGGVRWKAGWAVAAAALGLVIAVGGVMGVVTLLTSPTTPLAVPADVAIVTASRNARWTGTGLRLGEAVGPRRLQLEEGEVTLGLVSGAEVVVRSPADFAVRSGLRLQLLAGSLAARVPPEAEGLVVDAPHVDVVDLGTEFGVRAANRTPTDVRVFKGRVETRAGTAPSARIDVLEAGMARRFLPDGRIEEGVVGDAAFPQLPSETPEAPVTSGAIHLLAESPSTLQGLRTDQFMLLYREAARVPLPARLPLDIAAPGIYNTRGSVRPRPGPAGRVVDSYLLHFRARSRFPGNDSEGLVLDGSVTFPGPIVGIACLARSLDASDVIAGEVAKTAVALEYRGLEFGPQDSDHVVLSTDRRTLWVSLRVSAFIDQIRVFVSPAG